MIVACPNCATRYQVDDGALRRPGGRRLRCAGCGHTWQYRPEPLLSPSPPEPAPSAPEPAAPPLAVPLTEARGAALPPAAAPRRSAWAAFAWVSLIVIVAAAILVAIVDRQAIVARWPATGPAYAAIGLPVELGGAALKISNIAPIRTADGLVIEGDVTNSGKLAHEVPRLRLSLRDAAQKEVQYKIITPPKPRLGPGEVAHFKAPFEKPSSAATDVEVTFASS